MVLQDHLLRQQFQHARVKLQFAEVDVLDASLLVGFIQALGEHTAHGEADLGTGQKHVVEGRLLENGARSRLHGDHARRAGLSREQRHFAKTGAGLQLTQQEVDSGVGVFLADFHGAGSNEKHRVARPAFLHDNLLRSKLSRAQPAFEQPALLVGKPAE